MKNLAKISFVVLVVAGVGSARADEVSKKQLADQLYDLTRLQEGFFLQLKDIQRKIFEKIQNKMNNNAKTGEGPHLELFQKCQSTKAYDKFLGDVVNTIIPFDELKDMAAKAEMDEFSEKQLAEIVKYHSSEVSKKTYADQPLTAEEQNFKDQYYATPTGKLEKQKRKEFMDKIENGLEPVLQKAENENFFLKDSDKPAKHEEEIDKLYYNLAADCAAELNNQ